MQNRLGIVAVPTASIIGHVAGSPNLVYTFVPTKKHGGRKVIAGGRVVLGEETLTGPVNQQTAVQCALDEWDQELGGKGATLVSPRILGIATDLTRDRRDISWGKFQHEMAPVKFADLGITACYGCPDLIIMSEVSGEPAPKDGEAKKVVVVDVFEELRPEDFGAGQDVCLLVYRTFLRTGQLPPPCAMADFAMTRLHVKADGNIDYDGLEQSLFAQSA